MRTAKGPQFVQEGEVSKPPLDERIYEEVMRYLDSAPLEGWHKAEEMVDPETNNRFDALRHMLATAETVEELQHDRGYPKALAVIAANLFGLGHEVKNFHGVRSASEDLFNNLLGSLAAGASDDPDNIEKVIKTMSHFTFDGKDSSDAEYDEGGKVDPNAVFPLYPGPNLNADILIDYIVDTRGGDKDMWKNVADMVAYHESGPQQRMNPNARQILQGGGEGPGRGMFQFEDSTASGSFDTAKQRYKNTIDSVRDRGYVLELDPEIIEAKNADDLTADQQRAIFYANLIQGPASLSDYAEGNMSLEDLWIQGHKLVEKEENRKSFRESVADANKKKENMPTREQGGRVVSYKHGGKHDGDPPKYSAGKQVLDYLSGYGVPGGNKDRENRFETTLDEMKDFFMSRQGQELSSEPRTKYDHRKKMQVERPSQREELNAELARALITEDRETASKYSHMNPYYRAENEKDPKERSFVGQGVVDPQYTTIDTDTNTVTYGKNITEDQLKEIKKTSDRKRSDMDKGSVIYNYPASNPSARADAEEFYHAVQKAALRSKDRTLSMSDRGTSKDFEELQDMSGYVNSGGMLSDYIYPSPDHPNIENVDKLGRLVDPNPAANPLNLYQSSEPIEGGNSGYYEGTSAKRRGAGSLDTPGYYYFGDNKLEGDAAINAGIHFAKEMGILPEGEITAEDLPEVLKRFKGYTATQQGKTELNEERLKDWKPDGRKIVKVGKNGKTTLTKYGKKWIQDDQNKARFKERAMTQSDPTEARLDNSYMRILEGLIYDAANERNVFNPERMNPGIARDKYDESAEWNKSYNKNLYPEHPSQHFSSGKMPIDLLMNVINSGGGFSKGYRQQSAEQELLRDNRLSPERSRKEFDLEMKRINR
jgi:hypothetical protein